eukprot:TRINITY_DN5000_c0_g1_i1.p1 TRINITY_DN5000_c0_g1~~TRINITY_DN5000_c0_g1_i1.p1  ORF type:complete len:251 (+),score=42.25 TRINITY_DN5000_c0_g1_i1:108-755(+)
MPSYGNTGANADGSRMNLNNHIGGRPSIRLLGRERGHDTGHAMASLLQGGMLGDGGGTPPQEHHKPQCQPPPMRSAQRASLNGGARHAAPPPPQRRNSLQQGHPAPAGQPTQRSSVSWSPFATDDDAGAQHPAAGRRVQRPVSGGGVRAVRRLSGGSGPHGEHQPQPAPGPSAHPPARRSVGGPPHGCTGCGLNFNALPRRPRFCPECGTRVASG